MKKVIIFSSVIILCLLHVAVTLAGELYIYPYDRAGERILYCTVKISNDVDTYTSKQKLDNYNQHVFLGIDKGNWDVTIERRGYFSCLIIGNTNATDTAETIKELYGDVKTRTGKDLKGVKVKIEGEEDGETYKDKTDSNGEYIL